MEHSTQKLFSEKIKVFVTVEPFNIRFAALFNANEQIKVIKNFVQNKMKQLGIKFSLGRLELKDKLAILLPEFHIGDFLENDSEVIAYNQEYGLNMRTLPGDGMDQRPFLQKVHLLYEESSFTKKKTNRNNNHNKNKKNENNKKPKTEGNQKNDSKQEKKNDNKNEKKKDNNKQEKKEVKNESKKTEEKVKNNKEDSNKKDKSKKEEDLEEIKKQKKANQKMKSEKKEKKHEEYVKDSDDEAESSK